MADMTDCLNAHVGREVGQLCPASRFYGGLASGARAVLSTAISMAMDEGGRPLRDDHVFFALAADCPEVVLSAIPGLVANIESLVAFAAPVIPSGVRVFVECYPLSPQLLAVITSKHTTGQPWGPQQLLDAILARPSRALVVLLGQLIASSLVAAPARSVAAGFSTGQIPENEACQAEGSKTTAKSSDVKERAAADLSKTSPSSRASSSNTALGAAGTTGLGGSTDSPGLPRTRLRLKSRRCRQKMRCAIHRRARAREGYSSGSGLRGLSHWPS